MSVKDNHRLPGAVSIHRPFVHYIPSSISPSAENSTDGFKWGNGGGGTLLLRVEAVCSGNNDQPIDSIKI